MILNFRLGLFFISTAVIFWGILPIALKLSASFIDPVTLTWFRFLIALIVSFFIQFFTGKLQQFKQLTKAHWLKLAIAAIFSIFNYVSFVYCLEYLSPGQAQLNFQTAPFFLAFGGLILFKEKLKPVQMMCFATLALGMMLFFNPYLDFSNTENNKIWLGILIVQFSALSWTCYALIQKSLVKNLSPNNILLFIYGFGLFAMMPFSDLNYFLKMNINEWWIVLFCAVNTLIAYGCFAQSMKYWPTSQVGPMIALTPILSFSSTAFVAYLGWWPDKITSTSLDFTAIIGIAIVVLSVFGIQVLPKLLESRKLKLRTAC
ncbi:DMT family transporter [Pseudoalteromonas denitrificans]|uniref:EamA domain-containing membrane protein RarD n=1 Tax=Pseudoalteromonas denitrificans DSM 6059 TaxID=1123010 RepID=A0A1I1LYT9_9GAMM|nr:DMT family transporter [Pseudoalteromonas denitrificans]SFC78155.1 EamA domain-containing membrane protein RarD [Pseudoalteromonas denitrificans DSM 6059]